MRNKTFPTRESKKQKALKLTVLPPPAFKGTKLTYFMYFPWLPVKAAP
jgi:hypothetical protein